VPTLFATLADRHVAGSIAGELFRAVTLASLVLAAALAAVEAAARAGLARIGLALLPALLLGASEWLVRPSLEAARASPGPGSAAFAAWHGLAGTLYWTATLVLVVRLVRALRA
jgi:hypothetical protein